MAVAVAIGLALLASPRPASDVTDQPAPTASVAAVPFAGGAGGCVAPDPTTSGCLTPATAHALTEIDRVFGGYRSGPRIRSTTCWDAHAWNPSSDHPKGRACDLFPGAFGEFPTGPPLDAGWELANWLRTNADALHVRYVIWQGRIWQAGQGDVGGWGKRYTGGGVYDPTDATGGHFDHVHVSFQP